MNMYELGRLCFSFVSCCSDRLLRLLFVLVPTFVLVACGGGGGGSPPLTDSELEQLEMDPRIAQRAAIVERAETLLLSSRHLDYILRGNGRTVQDKTEVSYSCNGSRCRGSDYTVVTIDDDFFNNGIDATAVSIGGRGGFNTAVVDFRYDLPRTESGVTFTRFPDPKAYGLWGEYGYAAVQIDSGQISGRVDGISFNGEGNGTAAYVLGTATGSNPSGVGSATWRGIAEAASTRTFRRHSGTATVFIANLSRPRVSVAIDIPGFISESWSGIRVTSGRYSAGTAGYDHLVGDFFGPDHGETYGIFDTGRYVGTYGAKLDE